MKFLISYGRSGLSKPSIFNPGTLYKTEIKFILISSLYPQYFFGSRNFPVWIKVSHICRFLATAVKRLIASRHPISPSQAVDIPRHLTERTLNRE